MLSKIFWKKAQLLFPKNPAQIWTNNLPIQQISMRKRWKDTHLILWHELQNKLGPSLLLCTFKSPDHGDELSSQIPLSRKDKFYQMPHICPPPPSPLGLNIDGCINKTLKIMWSMLCFLYKLPCLSQWDFALGQGKVRGKSGIFFHSDVWQPCTLFDQQAS